MQTTPPCSSEHNKHITCYPEQSNTQLTVVVKPVNDCLEAVVLHDDVPDAVVSADDVFPSLNDIYLDRAEMSCYI